MIYICLCDRREFVDFITNRKPLDIRRIKSAESIEEFSFQDEDILLVWQKSPTDSFSLPNVVIVAEMRLQDFLAWVSTYFRHIRPFTAHCRVVTPSMAQLSMQASETPSPIIMRSADIGLILAEGIAYSVGRSDLNRLSFSSFSRTLSFTYSYGVRRYGRLFLEDRKIFEQTKNGWFLTRELLNQPFLKLSPEDISDVWTLMLCALANTDINQIKNNQDLVLIKALQAISKNGFIPKEIWAKISINFKKTESIIEELEGPREVRVKAVEFALQELAQGPVQDRRHRAFIAGYIVSRIQPGNLDHFHLLYPASAEIRESLLWYGACSGLTPETTVDNYGNGLGWLMKRELTRPSYWLDRPNCDIALSEMQILFRDREIAKIDFQTLAKNVLRVEVFPLIPTSVKCSESDEKQINDKYMHTAYQKNIFDEDIEFKNNISKILSKIDESSNSLDTMRKQIEEMFSKKLPEKRKRRR